MSGKHYLPKSDIPNQRPVGPASFVYDASYQTTEQINEQLWDEVIDYILALRYIAHEANACSCMAEAKRVLRKHGKEEEPREDD